ncbi:MAG: hypothetical protein IPL25_13260 [Saprospiraceae bacterium]|nr:hypothetical protein [Candidatus Vicinibacter affinis]
MLKRELWGKQLMLNAETWTYKILYTIWEMLNRKPPQYRSSGILSNLAVLEDTLLSRSKSKNIITGETAFVVLNRSPTAAVEPINWQILNISQ